MARRVAGGHGQVAQKESMNPWVRVHKGDSRARVLADCHYTRQNPGHPMWTRPGYNYVLLVEPGLAVWCWWRPKWEAGVERKDGLRCLECTIFRRTLQAPLASSLVCWAVDALWRQEAFEDLRLANAVPITDGLITGVGSVQTQKGRSKNSLPGKCFLAAGWRYFDHRPGRADVWLKAP